MKITTPPKSPTPTNGIPDGWLFKPIERPSFTDSLKFPDDITKASLAEVSMLHGRYIALYAYVVSETAKLGQELLRLDSELFVRKNNVSRTGLTNGHNKQKVDLYVRLDMTMQQIQLRRNVVQERKDITDKFLDIFDRYAGALSREMTRRTSEMNRT
jgi:hypothetical protein